MWVLTWIWRKWSNLHRYIFSKNFQLKSKCLIFSKEIDYCKSNLCVSNATCLAVKQSYTCICEFGQSGDGFSNGTGCCKFSVFHLTFWKVIPPDCLPPPPSPNAICVDHSWEIESTPLNITSNVTWQGTGFGLYFVIIYSNREHCNKF